MQGYCKSNKIRGSQDLRTELSCQIIPVCFTLGYTMLSLLTTPRNWRMNRYREASRSNSIRWRWCLNNVNLAGVTNGDRGSDPRQQTIFPHGLLYLVFFLVMILC